MHSKGHVKAILGHHGAHLSKSSFEGVTSDIGRLPRLSLGHLCGKRESNSLSDPPFLRS
jgi:hypothetical protein